MTNLTFEQFQATRTWEDDLSGWLKWEDCEETVQGYLYGTEGDLALAKFRESRDHIRAVIVPLVKKEI